MSEYKLIIDLVGVLIYDVHNAILSGDKAEELRALKEAVKQLPSLINKFKMLKPTTPEVRKAMWYQAQGMDLYLLACSNLIQAHETSDDEFGRLAAKQFEEASNLMDKSAAVIRREIMR